MKKRHNVTHNIKSFCKLISDGTVVFNHPFQREGGQWNDEQKSLLIHSLATDFDITPIYSVGIISILDNGQSQTKYSITDGQQRLTTIADYLKNTFALLPTTQPVRIGETIYELGGLTFSELPEPVQDAIHDYSVIMFYFVNVTDDEIAEMFYRQSNGRAMSVQNRLKFKIGITAADSLNHLKQAPFIAEIISLTEAQRKRGDNERVLMQASMLLNNEDTALTVKEMNTYAEVLKQSSPAHFEMIELALLYLHTVFPIKEKRKMLNKNHVPFLIALANYAIQLDVREDMFQRWIHQFEAEENTSKDALTYFEHTKGILTSRKVKIALEAMLRDFELYIQ